MIEAKELRVSYGKRRALDGVSFSLREGEMLFVIGPNGSGKTTLLKSLARVLRAEGAIYVDGKSAFEFSRDEYAKMVGYVPQRGEISHLTVFDAVLLGRKPHFKWRAEKEDFRIVEKVLEILNLNGLATKKLNELSGGEFQRVMIARALAQQPKILLLDEPTNNLDINNQVAFMKLLKRIVKKEKISAIITTHDLNIASNYADRIVMMKSGKIYASGGIEILTEENIKAVYGVEVDVIKLNGKVIILPK